MSTFADEIVPLALFEKIFKSVQSCVRRHEKKRNGSHYDDCYVRNDCLGPPQILFYVISLDVLTPSLVADLRKTLTGYARWEIVVIICPPTASSGWPEMGLRIREGEIIDDLQREYLPAAFRNLQFKDARP